MKYIKNTLLFFLLLGSSLVVGQERRESLEKIKALKMAYITEQLNLSAEEAQSFWPIYNLHSDELHQLRTKDKIKMRVALKTNGGIDNLTEIQAKELINFRLTIEKKIHQENVLMLQELSEVISQKKIVKLQVAEYEFKRKLINKLKGDRRKDK